MKGPRQVFGEALPSLHPLSPCWTECVHQGWAPSACCLRCSAAEMLHHAQQCLMALGQRFLGEETSVEKGLCPSSVISANPKMKNQVELEQQES